MVADTVTPRDLGREAMLAMRAVAEALSVARVVEHEAASSALTKGDDSPVTVADFSVQALVARQLGRHFPERQSGRGRGRLGAARHRFGRRIGPRRQPGATCRRAHRAG